MDLRPAWCGAVLAAVLLLACTSSDPPDPSPTDPPPLAPGATGRHYWCSGTMFDPALLESAEGLEQDDPELHDLVERLERSPLGDASEWRVVSIDGATVNVIGLLPGGGYAWTGYERSGERWTPLGFSECEPTVAVGRRLPVPWKLAEEPAPDDEELVVKARETICSGGRRLTQRNTRSHVDYTAEAVSIVVSADPIGGGDCVGNRAWRLVVRLSEPVGDRAVYDAITYPPERRYP